MYARILVALDGSALAERVLPHAQALAERFGATVALLRATPPPEQLALSAGPDGAAFLDVAAMRRDERREADRYLRAVATRLAGQGLVVERERPEGTAAEAIVERARGSRADLIAMTTHGRGGFGRLVFGSVADEVLRRAPCPVLLVRVHDGSAADG